MNIHIDILTPKQVMMFGPLSIKLRKRGHKVSITTRDYLELNQMVCLHKMNSRVIGKHGGGDLYSKLVQSIKRTEELSQYLYDLEPDICVSHGSPETARVAYGLGIPNINVNDSPHSESVSKLTVPFCSKLLTPEMIPFEDWTRYGITEDSIVTYYALDPWAWLRDYELKYDIRKILDIENDNPIITFRVLETQASYARGLSSPIMPAVEQISKRRLEVNIIVLPRYKSQLYKLKKKLGEKVIIPHEMIDGPSLLKSSIVFIGAGGTMTTEAAILGVPTISCYPKNQLHVHIWLKDKGLISFTDSQEAIVKTVERYLKRPDERRNLMEKAQEITSKFVDPNNVILKEIEKFE
jgi:predicted glycosyltransferase